MSWKTHTHELIRLGRIHHPQAVDEFLESIDRLYWCTTLEEAVSSLPASCEGMATSMLRAARLEGAQDDDILNVIQAAARETRDVKPLSALPVPTPTHNITALWYPYCEDFGPGPIAGNPF